MTPN
jgi:hypothetical protein